MFQNFKNDNITSILKYFATNLKDNINKVIHKFNIKTLHNVATKLQHKFQFKIMENTNEQKIFNILNNLNIKEQG